MSDWSNLAASGRGRVAHLLEVAGIPDCYATIAGWTPSDSWFSTRGYDAVRSWLMPRSFDFDELARFLEGDLEAGGITVEIADIGGAMTATLQDFAVRGSTRLAEAVTASATSIPVLSAAALPDATPAAPERAWAGLECFTYTGKTGNTLTGCTRGALGTTARAYSVDDTREPPIGIMITDGPTDIRGRPCRLHAAVIDPVTGAPGETEVIFRGFVGQALDIGDGAWSVPIDHCSVVFGRNVAQGMGETTIRPGYAYLGGEYPGLATTFYKRKSSTSVGDTYVTVRYGWFESYRQLAASWNEASDDAGAILRPYLGRSEDGSKVILYAEADSSYWLEVEVREGDVLWALGFEPGTYTQDLDVAWIVEAQDEPRLLVVDWSAEELAAGYCQIAAYDTAAFTDGLHAALPGYPYAAIESASGDWVTFTPGSQDPARRVDFWMIEDEEDLVLRHVFAFSPLGSSPDNLSTVVQKLLGLASGQAEPAEWCAGGLAADDIDFDELDDALEGAPLELQLFYDALTEPAAAKDVFGARLGLLGIAPRVTTAARIGFVRLETPTVTGASSIELDADVWELVSAKAAAARLGGEPLLTQAIIQCCYDYRDEKWAKPIKITWADGIAERGRVRAISYDLRGLLVSSTSPGCYDDRASLEAAIAPWLTAIHYGMYGRLAADLEVPCTWTAKQFFVGDIVRVTHPTLPDLHRGVIGTTDRLGTVIGRRQKHSEDAPDVLTLHVPPASLAGGISACALATSWDSGGLVLTCPDAGDPLYAGVGANDLDEFAAGDKVLLWAYDLETQPAGFPIAAQLDSVGTTTLKLDSDHIGGDWPSDGVWVVFVDWSKQTTAQRAFLSICDTTYALGPDNDQGFQWGI